MSISKIYLNRHFPKHLCLDDLRKLSLDRVKAYYKKHRHYIGQFDHDTYPYIDSDFRYNGEFDTNVCEQFKAYFNDIKRLINKKQAQEKIS